VKGHSVGKRQLRGIEENADGLLNPRQLFILSGPSGVGKNTIADRLRREGRALRAITATTRPPKPGEVDGRDYIFVSEGDFRQRVKDGRLIEHTCYLGHCYGTPLASVNEAAESGLPVILTIDVDGGLQVKKKWPDVSLIFIEAPSEEELRRRLRHRQRDDTVSIEQRIKRARQEYEYADLYDFRVVNDDLDDAVELVAGIISRQCKPEADHSI